MKDKHITEFQIFEYLDGEMEPSGRGLVERHLNECRICKKELEKTRLLFLNIEAVQDIYIPRNFAPDIMNSIRQPSFMPRQWHLAIAFQLLLSSALILIAWPFVNAHMADLIIPKMQWNTEQIISQLSIQVTIWKGDIVNIVSTFFDQADNVIQFFPEELVSIIWPLVISASLVWMVGNGLLLHNGSMKNR